MRLRRPLPAVQGDTLHIVGVGDNRIGKEATSHIEADSKTGAELLFEVFSQRYEGGSTLVTSNLPFDEWTEVFGSERLTGALLDRLTHHVHILEMNGDSYRLNQSQKRRKPPKT